MKRKILTTAIAGILAAPMAANAIEYAVSGQVNRIIRFADDGKASDIQFLDGSQSSSRIRWVGNGDIGRGMKAGFRLESEVSSSGSAASGIKLNGDDSAATDTVFNMRYSAIDFSGKWGKISLGQTNAAGDGFADQNLTAHQADGYDISGDVAGGIQWRTGGGGVIVQGGAAQSPRSGGLTVGASGGTLDGGRQDVLRYDSPALGPVTIATSVGNDQYFDIGAYVDANLGGGQFQLAGGWIKADNYDGTQRWAVSASYRFSQGTGIAGTYSVRDYKSCGTSCRNDATYWAIAVGHKWGNNAVSLSYGQADDVANVATTDLATYQRGWIGMDRNNLNIGFTHTLPKPGVDLYAGFIWNELDGLNNAARTSLNLNGDAEDVYSFYVGSRVQFD